MINIPTRGQTAVAVASRRRDSRINAATTGVAAVEMMLRPRVSGIAIKTVASAGIVNATEIATPAGMRHLPVQRPRAKL